VGTVTNRFVPALAVTVAFCALTAAQQPQIQVLPVQGSVSMLAGAGANVTLQIGKDGVLLVDTPPAALVPQVLAEIRRLSDRPIRYLLNTSLDAEHTGGNAAVIGPAAGRGTGGARNAHHCRDRQTGTGARHRRPAGERKNEHRDDAHHYRSHAVDSYHRRASGS